MKYGIDTFKSEIDRAYAVLGDDAYSQNWRDINGWETDRYITHEEAQELKQYNRDCDRDRKENPPTLKEIRRSQLTELIQSDRIDTVSYRVEELNDSFLLRRTWEFTTAKEANAMYNTLSQHIRPAFLRKYAVVRF